jgi:poly-beta-hydroxybutyrate-responsive repressor
MHGNELRSLLHPFLLLLLVERPDHGYDLTCRLGHLGVAGVDASHVYRVLRGLEHDGLVVSGWVASSAGPARRRYEVTAKGIADVEHWTERLAVLEHVLDTFLSRWAEASTGPARGRENGSRRPVAMTEP